MSESSADSLSQVSIFSFPCIPCIPWLNSSYSLIEFFVFRGSSPLPWWVPLDVEQVAVPAALDDLRARCGERLAGAFEMAGGGSATDDQRGRAGRADRGGRGPGPAGDPGRRLRD